MTNSEAIESLEQMIKWGDPYEVDEDACKVAIKALRQEPKTDVLDKIRAEVESIEISGQINEHSAFIRSGECIKTMVLDIIDKYKAEKGDME